MPPQPAGQKIAGSHSGAPVRITTTVVSALAGGELQFATNGPESVSEPKKSLIEGKWGEVCPLYRLVKVRWCSLRAITRSGPG
jgi:hypothetical protein